MRRLLQKKHHASRDFQRPSPVKVLSLTKHTQHNMGESRSRSRSASGSRGRRSRSRSRSRSGGGGAAAGTSGDKVTGVALRWQGQRGFGFIKPDDGGEDLFCHVSAIEDGNCLVEGAKVSFLKGQDERSGRDRAQNVTGGTTEDASGGGGGGQGGDPGPAPEGHSTGVALRWNPRGFGFIKPDDGSVPRPRLYILQQLRGAMDSVSDFESGGCGFESRRGCYVRRRDALAARRAWGGLPPPVRPRRGAPPPATGGVAQWQSVRFACGKPRVQTPAPPT